MRGPTGVRRIIATALCAMAMLFGASGPAHATLVVGSWDPPFGAPFPELGWRGEAVFYIADSCSTNSAALTHLQCGAGSMSVVSAVVEFYRLDDPATTLQTLDFGNAMLMSAAHFDAAGTIDGISAFTWLPQPGLIAEATLHNGHPTYFGLAFSFAGGSTEARLGYFDSLHPWINGWNDNSDPSRRAMVTLQEVPEPASAALLLAALAAAGVARRRSTARYSVDKA